MNNNDEFAAGNAVSWTNVHGLKRYARIVSVDETRPEWVEILWDIFQFDKRKNEALNIKIGWIRKTELTVTNHTAWIHSVLKQDKLENNWRQTDWYKEALSFSTDTRRVYARHFA
jgi:hypothetical protein